MIIFWKYWKSKNKRTEKEVVCLKSKILSIIFFIFSFLFLLTVIEFFIKKNDIIINIGLKSYQTCKTNLILITISLFFIDIFCFLSYLKVRNMKKEKEKEEIYRRKEEEIKEKKEKSKLAVSNRLDSHKLRKMLKSIGIDFSLSIKSIDECISQMERMDGYQERLHNLLDNNGANVLSDTEEILDKAEQYMCRNVRKVINYMSISEPGNMLDEELIKKKIGICYDDNNKVLGQVQEFLVALTEFLNKQGENEQDISMLEIYKETILDSVSERKDKEKGITLTLN